MNDVVDLSKTITPKSDQLNADDLLTGPITVVITGVSRGSTEQPVSIAIDGGYQPFKPCKSMRRVLISLWGDNGLDWVGRSMTLYCDPEVKFGGVKVGGIRISHMSHINGRQSLMLTTTRARRSEYFVEQLTDAYAEYEAEVLPLMRNAAMSGITALQEAYENLPQSEHKNRFWMARGEELKSAAKHNDETTIKE